MIQTHQSLYRSERMFTTGDNPILITCEDFSNWVCKHGRMYPSVLFSEVIGSSFAELWDLKTPKISLIDVSADHLPIAELHIVQPAYFKKPCFGSSYIEESQVIDKTLIPSFNNQAFRNKIKNKTDLLKIALFDIWIGNEDRHHANSNLLIDFTVPQEYLINVFDHGAIFNSNTLNHGIQLITDYESIICSDIAKILFKKGKILTKTVDNIVKDFYLCTIKCEQELSSIISEIPALWNLDLISLEAKIRGNLLTDRWKKDCEKHFRTLIQTYI